ncbi:uncharacterized protein LOC116181650 [Photinus pyralis]|uniref:uncharacterized protein LOC116181650 n=1 Tax=Photinus pyralis TaxID=7054 RepID=UPI0012671A74|nr:uncharacterized protein LOC116181650 [Photinus pyralis]
MVLIREHTYDFHIQVELSKLAMETLEFGINENDEEYGFLMNNSSLRRALSADLTASDSILLDITNREDNQMSACLSADVLELQTLLTNWKLDRLLNHLVDQKVFVPQLKMMGRHHVRELLEKYDVGTRIEFEHYLSLWRQSIGIPLNSYETGPTGSGMTRQLASTSIWVDNLEPSDIRSPCSSHHSTDAGSGAKVLLATILKDSPKAALLMEYWEKNSKFDNEQRGALISLIARYFEDNRIPMTMAASYQLEREIVERFPTEKLEFYRTNKRGKLYNKWRNSNGRFNKAVLKKTEKTDTSRTDIALDSEKDAEDIIRSLRNDDLSAEELDRFWKACGNYRLNQIRTANSTAEILKKWPQYKTPSGYRFIEFDFVILNRDSKDPSSIWEAGANKIIQFLANSIKDKELKTLIKSLDEDMEENGRNATILWLLHGFFVPSNRGTQTDINGKKKITK